MNIPLLPRLLHKFVVEGKADHQEDPELAATEHIICYLYRRVRKNMNSTKCPWSLLPASQSEISQFPKH
jgi:hypothetical protein